MHGIIGRLVATFLQLGPFGLLILGLLDSSFLFMPLGNDLLLIALTARHHARLPLYALMATAGSVLGCLLVDWVARKGGEEGLEKFASGRRLDCVKGKVRDSAGWALAFAAVMPPPFPFTPFVAGAAAFQYPRARLLTIIAAARLVRFATFGLLAILFGRGILRIAESPAVQGAILALVVVCIVGSAWSVYSWLTRR